MCGKGENAGKQHFVLFPQCFLLFQWLIPSLGPHLMSVNTFIVDQSNILPFGKRFVVCLTPFFFFELPVDDRVQHYPKCLYKV